MFSETFREVPEEYQEPERVNEKPIKRRDFVIFLASLAGMEGGRRLGSKDALRKMFGADAESAKMPDYSEAEITQRSTRLEQEIKKELEAILEKKGLSGTARKNRDKERTEKVLRALEPELSNGIRKVQPAWLSYRKKLMRIEKVAEGQEKALFGGVGGAVISELIRRPGDKEKQSDVTRRRFLTSLGLGAGGYMGAKEVEKNIGDEDLSKSTRRAGLTLAGKYNLLSSDERHYVPFKEDLKWEYIARNLVYGEKLLEQNYGLKRGLDKFAAIFYLMDERSSYKAKIDDKD